MSVNSSFANLMARLRAHDNEAAAQVLARFAHRLIALARSRLDALLRRKVDPEDVMQSVYRSFFGRFGRGEFDLETWDNLWSLLVLLTVRKCSRQAEHFHAARRDVRREADLTNADAESRPSDLVARAPTPAEAALFADTLEELLRGLDDRERRIVALSLEGQGPAEIATQVERTQRTVNRVLERVRRRLDRMHESDAEP